MLSLNGRDRFGQLSEKDLLYLSNEKSVASQVLTCLHAEKPRI